MLVRKTNSRGLYSFIDYYKIQKKQYSTKIYMEIKAIKLKLTARGSMARDWR